MVSQSAGVLLFRRSSDSVEVLVGHMGGPFWGRKHEGAWSIPKGEADAGEALPDAAAREFEEELGIALPGGTLVDLGSVRQGTSKVVTVFALEADIDLDGFRPGLFEMEWPPRSGRMQSFPEIDRVRWLATADAMPLLVAAQRPFLDRLLGRLGNS